MPKTYIERKYKHEERVKKFENDMKKKSLIICYDFETCTDGEMLPYMVVFSFMFYNLTEDE